MPVRPAARRRALAALTLPATMALGLPLAMPAPALASEPTGTPAASVSGWYAATVTRVIDGDTFVTSAGQTIRVLGLDSPETSECFGSQATGYARRALLGERVLLARDTIQPGKDKYGRDLRHVRVNGGNYTVKAIRKGYGESYADTYVNALAARYNAAERNAQARARGLWSSCNGATPTTTRPSTPVAPPTGSGCDPNYTGYCVPLVSYDLDCADIGHAVNVVGRDPHGFDADGDSIGCETYS